MLFHCRDLMQDRRMRPPLMRADRVELLVIYAMFGVIALGAIAGSKRPDHHHEGTVIMGPCPDCPAQIDRVQPVETGGYKRSDGSFQGQ